MLSGKRKKSHIISPHKFVWHINGRLSPLFLNNRKKKHKSYWSFDKVNEIGKGKTVEHNTILLFFLLFTKLFFSWFFSRLTLRFLSLCVCINFKQNETEGERCMKNLKFLFRTIYIWFVKPRYRFSQKLGNFVGIASAYCYVIILHNIAPISWYFKFTHGQQHVTLASL